MRSTKKGDDSSRYHLFSLMIHINQPQPDVHQHLFTITGEARRSLLHFFYQWFGAQLGDVFAKNPACASHHPAALCRCFFFATCSRHRLCAFIIRRHATFVKKKIKSTPRCLPWSAGFVMRSFARNLIISAYAMRVEAVILEDEFLRAAAGFFCIYRSAVLNIHI